MEYEHELAIKELGIEYNSFSRSLKAKVNRFGQMKARLEANPNEKKQQELVAYSAVLADEIQDFYEKDFPETSENVLTPEEKAARRAEYERAWEKLNASQGTDAE